MVKEELDWLKDNGIIVRILNLPTTLIDFQGQTLLMEMINNILIEVWTTLAQDEIEKREKRQREGIAAMPIIDGKRVSMLTGNAMGRPANDYPDFPKFLEKNKKGEMSVVECCKHLGISRTHWYRLCKGA